ALAALPRRWPSPTPAYSTRTTQLAAPSASPVGAVHDRDQLRVAPEIAALSSAWRSPTGAYCTCITKVASSSPSPVGAVHDRDQHRAALPATALSSAWRSPAHAAVRITRSLLQPNQRPTRLNCNAERLAPQCPKYGCVDRPYSNLKWAQGLSQKPVSLHHPMHQRYPPSTQWPTD